MPPNEAGTGGVAVSKDLRDTFFLQIQSGANTPVKKFLLNFAATMKMIEVKQGIIRNDSLLDKLVFKKVQVSSSKCK